MGAALLVFALAIGTGGTAYAKDLPEQGDPPAKLRDLSGSQALKAGEKTFPTAIGADTWKPFKLLPGQEVDKFLSPSAMLVEDEHGNKSLAQSSFPMRVPNAAGKQALVDLRLQATAAGWVPRNPIVPVEIGRTLKDGVGFADQPLRVHLAGGKQRVALTNEAGAFYPNVFDDADYMVAPRPRGAELSWQLRSAGSPEKVRLEFDLPAGAQVVEASDQPGVVRVTKDGELLAVLSAPQAVDAELKPVPVKTTVDATGVSYRVNHRGKGYTYPILLDPAIDGPDGRTVKDDMKGWASGSAAGYLDWVAGQIGSSFAFTQGAGWAVRGLHVETRNDATAYPTDSFGQWQYTAQRQAFVYRAQFYNIYHDSWWTQAEFGLGNINNQPEPNQRWWGFEGTSDTTVGQQGVRKIPDGATNFYTEVCAAPKTSDGKGCKITSGWVGNRAEAKLRIRAGAPSRPPVGRLAVGGAVIWLNDTNTPTLRSGSLVHNIGPPATTKWYDSFSGQVTGTFDDPGLGMKFVDVMVKRADAVDENPADTWPEEGISPNPKTDTCGGERASCQTAMTGANLNYTISKIKSGTRTIILKGEDVVAHKNLTSATWPINVDHEKPDITLGGRLYRHRVDNPDGQDDELQDEQYTLSIDASDGVKNANPAAIPNVDRRSGVGSLQVDILKTSSSGTVAQCEAGSISENSYTSVKPLTTNPTSGNNAAMSLDVDFRPDAFDSGRRVVRVQAKDRVDTTPNVTRKCFEIDIARPPRTGKLGYFSTTDLDLTDRLQLSVNNAHGNLLAQNSDLSLKGVGLDVALGRVYNSWDKPDTYGDAKPKDKYDFSGELGRGWQLSMGENVRLYDDPDSDTVIFRGPTGSRVRYTNPHADPDRDASHPDQKIYDRPFGVPAKLVQRDGLSGRYELRYFRQGVRWIFGPSGTLDRIIDQDDNMIELTHNAAGHLTKIEGGLVNGSTSKRRSRVINVNWNASSTHVDSISEPQLNRIYRYTYTAQNQLDTVTDPANAVVNYDYNSDGRLSKITDGRNQATDITYDTNAPAYARVASIQRPGDASGARPLLGFRWDENVTHPDEDGDTNIVRGPRHTASFDAETRYVTDDNDRVDYARAPDPDLNDDDVNGQKMSRGFDFVGNVNSFTSGETTNFEYPGKENLETTTRGGAGGMQSNLTYGDSAAPNYPTRSTDTNGNSKGYGYNTTMSTAEGGHRMGLVSVQNETAGSGSGEDARTELPRNDDGLIDKVNRRQGSQLVTTDYTYNGEHELIDIDYPAGSGESVAPLKHETFSYDDASRLDVHTDGRNKTFDYDYDAMDRVAKVTYASGDYTSYGYDANGNLASVTDKRGGATYVSTTYTLDNLNRLITETRGGAAVQSYTYDLNDNLKTQSEGGRTTTYTFDNRDLMASVSDQEGKLTCYYHGKEHRRLTSIRIEPTSCAAPGSARVLIDPDYDEYGRVTTLNATDSTGARIERFEYGYHDDGEPAYDRQHSLKDWVRDRNQNRCIDWDYDTLGRLREARMTDSADDCDFDGNGSANVVNRWKYEYDNAGNLTKKTQNGSDTTYRVNSRDQLCWEASGTPSGNCSSVPSGGVDYDYDDAGNLTNASGRYQLAYDEREHTSTITPSGAAAQSQTYTGEGQSERLTSGATSFLHGKLGLGWANVATVGTGDALPVGKTYFTRAADGSLVSQRKPDGTKEYFIFDAHPGSVVALVDPSKTVATSMVKARFRYDPYGNVTLNNGASDTPWRFAGAWFDRFPGPAGEQKGLYKMGERYYDPRTGRWTQRDPLDQSADLRGGNRYAYADGDPVNGSDPSGQLSFNDALGIGADLVGAGCFVGGLVSGGVGFAACGIVSTAISFAANSSSFAANPTPLRGASTATTVVGYGCAIGSLAARSAAVYDACGAGATAAGLYADTGPE